MDYETLDPRKDKDIIIPRSLYMTDNQSFEYDIAKLEKFYSPAQIVEQLKHTKERISNEVCRLVAKRYSVAAFYRYPVKHS